MTDIMTMKLFEKKVNKSPEKTDDYISVATPSVWLFMSAMLLLLIAVLIWGYMGKVPLKLTTVGVGYNYDHRMEGDEVSDEKKANGYFDVDTYLCLIKPDNITGKNLDNKPATVIFDDGTQISGYAEILETVPCSSEETEQVLDELWLNEDWIKKRLDMGEYRYIINVYLDRSIPFTAYGEPAQVIVEYAQVSPLYYLFGEE